MSQNNNTSNVLRVLAVDDDVVSLRILSGKLQQCGFNVTATTKATEALDMLKENKDGFDIVLTDIIMPDMDGFKLLEIIRKINIPVIMISADGEVETVVKGMKSGAEDYFVKPVKTEDLKRKLPEYVMKKSQSTEKCNKDETKKIYKTESEHIGKHDGVCQSALKKKLPEYVTKRPQSIENCNEDETTKINETESGSPRKKRKRKETESDQNGSPQKKKRTNWTPYLSAKFVKAVLQIEASNEPDNKVIPKKILQIMNEPGLTRECVASHLQKYRKGLMKKTESNGDNNNEQDPISSPELSCATEKFLERNGQYEPSGFGSRSVKDSNRVFTDPVNMFEPSRMLQKNYFQPSQMHLNPISSPMIPNSYGPQTLMLERRNSIPLNNAFQIPRFGFNQIPQYGLLAEVAPFPQYSDAFTSDFQRHRGFPNQMVVQPPHTASSLQGHSDALNENLNPTGQDSRNVSFRMMENLNAAGENDVSCSRMNTFNWNEQPKRTEHTQQHPNVQPIDRQSSYGLAEELHCILDEQDMVPLI